MTYSSLPTFSEASLNIEVIAVLSIVNLIIFFTRRLSSRTICVQWKIHLEGVYCSFSDLLSLSYETLVIV